MIEKLKQSLGKSDFSFWQNLREALNGDILEGSFIEIRIVSRPGVIKQCITLTHYDQIGRELSKALGKILDTKLVSDLHEYGIAFQDIKSKDGEDDRN